MSSSSNSSTDHHSKWEDTGRCDCNADNYEIWKIEWSTHNMGNVGRAAWNVFRAGFFFSGLAPLAVLGAAAMRAKDYTHEALHLFIRCRNCGRDMNLTCELLSSGKQMRWGFYGNFLYRRISKEVEPRLAYNKIKEIYDGMWEE
uniref:Yippee domain-containing protein n=1 Tax=Meloidogyne floridensis TaxID=298350 RepID=A0A915NL30_9BILA